MEQPSPDVAHYVEHYFGASDQPAGEHTVLIRRAFEQVQTRQKRKYGKVITALLVAVAAVGAYAVYEHQQTSLHKQMAQDLFYTMKSLDLNIANVENLVLDSHSEIGRQEIAKYRNQRKEMERGYEQFLSALHVYDPKMPPQDRVILRVARIVGECELAMPPQLRR